MWAHRNEHIEHIQKVRRGRPTPKSGSLQELFLPNSFQAVKRKQCGPTWAHAHNSSAVSLSSMTYLHLYYHHLVFGTSKWMGKSTTGFLCILSLISLYFAALWGHKFNPPCKSSMGLRKTHEMLWVEGQEQLGSKGLTPPGRWCHCVTESPFLLEGHFKE